jgi:hypothetical protein
MIDNLKRLNDLDIVLSRMDEDAINQLYLRVFQTADGELLLQDLANRLHEYIPTNSPFEEGQRSAYVSIVSRLKRAVEPKESE